MATLKEPLLETINNQNLWKRVKGGNDQEEREERILNGFENLNSFRIRSQTRDANHTHSGVKERMRRIHRQDITASGRRKKARPSKCHSLKREIQAFIPFLCLSGVATEEKGGLNCEVSKPFRLYRKGSHTIMAREWKISSPNGFLEDTHGFAYPTTFDSISPPLFLNQVNMRTIQELIGVVRV